MSERELDRRPGGRDEFMSDADARVATEKYVITCVTMIPLFGRSEKDLRRWWVDETERREKYGLDEDQIGRIVQACRDQVSLLKSRDRSVA